MTRVSVAAAASDLAGSGYTSSVSDLELHGDQRERAIGTTLAAGPRQVQP